METNIEARLLTFLDKNLNFPQKEIAPVDDITTKNAEAAEQNFGIPAAFWKDFTAELRSRDCECSPAWKRTINPFESAVMMGIAIGWYQATRTEKSTQSTKISTRIVENKPSKIKR